MVECCRDEPKVGPLATAPMKSAPICVRSWKNTFRRGNAPTPRYERPAYRPIRNSNIIPAALVCDVATSQIRHTGPRARPEGRHDVGDGHGESLLQATDMSRHRRVLRHRLIVSALDVFLAMPRAPGIGHPDRPPSPIAPHRRFPLDINSQRC